MIIKLLEVKSYQSSPRWKATIALALRTLSDLFNSCSNIVIKSGYNFSLFTSTLG